MRTIYRCLVFALGPLFLAFAAQVAWGQGSSVAIVNGVPISEADLEFAAAELREEVEKLPPATRRQALVEYMPMPLVQAEGTSGTGACRRSVIAWSTAGAPRAAR